MNPRLIILSAVVSLCAACASVGPIKHNDVEQRKWVNKDGQCLDRKGDVIPIERAFTVNGKPVCFDPNDFQIYVGDRLVKPYWEAETPSDRVANLIRNILYPKLIRDLIKKNDQ